MGHAKTILVLLGSWLFLGEKMTLKRLFGMALAVVGMVAYGHASTNAPAQAPTSKTTDEEEEASLIPEKSIPVAVLQSKEGQGAGAK